MSSDSVFYEPTVLRGKTAHSHFGAALAGIGNLNNDPHGFKGFLAFIMKLTPKYSSFLNHHYLNFWLKIKKNIVFLV